MELAKFLIHSHRVETTDLDWALAATTENPVLAELCLRIARQERRHYAWYYNSAREHLSDSPIGQWLTRIIMNKAWTPVGVGVKSEAQNAWVMRALFRGEHEALFTRLQEKLNALPGLESVDKPLRYAQAVTRMLERDGGRTAGDDSQMAQAA